MIPAAQRCCVARRPTTPPAPHRTATVPRQTESQMESRCRRSVCFEASRPRVARRQDQTRHGAHPRRLPIRVGFQRHRRSLVSLVPPHQRSIGLCRLKSSWCATIASPNSVSDSRLRTVGGHTIPQVFSTEGSQFVVKTRHGRNRTKRQPFQQIAVFRLAEDARPSRVAKIEKRYSSPYVPLRSSRPFAFPWLQARSKLTEARSANRSRAGLRSGNALKSLRSRSKQRFRGRRPIRLPGRARRREFPFSDIDGRRHPPAKPTKPDHLKINECATSIW